MQLVRSLGLTLTAFALVAGCGKPAETTDQGSPRSSSPTTGSAQNAVPVPEQLRFTAKTVDGQDFAGESLAGKAAVFWFWAPWCPSCRREAPTVAKLAESSAGVAFVGVAARDEVPAMKDFVAEHDLGSFPHVADLDGSVWQRFGVTAQPAFAFVGEDGAVDVVIGSPTEEELVARIGKLSGA